MKTAINKKFTITIFALLWVLVGCQSEVDKCTDAYMKADGPWKNNAEKAEREAQFRFACLRASKGG
jgi:hypothetical protein